MTAGLMQTPPLQIIDILKFASKAHAKRQIVSRLVDEPAWRYDYAGALKRAAQAANALKRLGIKAGDRVSSLAWNTHRHFELFYAVPGIGAVLHTANPRLFDEQIVYTINHAESSVLLFDRNFAGVVERIAPQLTSVKTFVMLSDEPRLLPGAVEAVSYECLLDKEPAEIAWPVVDENLGAFLCYTSGTTGDALLFPLSRDRLGLAVCCADQWLQAGVPVRQDGWREPAGADRQGGRHVLGRRADDLDDVSRAS